MLFRRLVTWAVNHKAGMYTQGFRSYLSTYEEDCFELADLVRNGTAEARRFVDFVTLTGKLKMTPGRAVFRDASSFLMNGQGRWIDTW